MLIIKFIERVSVFNECVMTKLFNSFQFLILQLTELYIFWG